MKHVTWIALALLSLAACGDDGPGATLAGKTWERQENPIHDGFLSMAFDRDGNLVGNSRHDTHTYRFEVAAQLWHDLGPWASGEVSRNTEGDVFMFVPSEDAAVSGIYRLDGDAWQRLIDFDENMNGLWALGRDGVIWSVSNGNDTLETVDVYRFVPGVSSGWEKTLSATLTDLQVDRSYIGGISSDNAGNVYVKLATHVRRLTPAGDRLDRFFDCDGKALHYYCEFGPPLFVYPDGTELYYRGGAAYPVGFFRHAPGPTAPEKMMDLPDGYHVATTIEFDQAGNVYYTGTFDYAGDVPTLLVAAAGSTSFTPVIEMPNLYAALVVRGDGEVFAFDPMLGDLRWLR